MAIKIRLNVLMAEKNLKLGELAKQIGINNVNLSILKNNKARAIRFSTLCALCEVLNCTPGDLIIYEPDEDQSEDSDEEEPLGE